MTETLPSRRTFTLAGAGAVLALSAAVLAPQVQAADPLTVGILIPGSKSDKGWMESGYDGLWSPRRRPMAPRSRCR